MNKKLIVIACGALSLVACAVITEQLTDPKPTVCDYKVTFIYRAQFRPGEEGDKDFIYSLTEQVAWLWNNGHEVLDVDLKYGLDMTQNLIIRFAIIKYKEIKNG